jgi:D-2-hydroxyacid dehydrogenase (NADP+)
MHVLLHRALPQASLDRLKTIAPAATFRHEPRLEALTPWPDEADVIFGNPPAAALKTCQRLRWLQIVSSGFDDYAALAGGSVVVTTAHGVHAHAIAQQVLMAILMFARGQLHFGECQRAAKWDRNPAVPFQLRGQTLGLIGFGLIGRQLASWGHGLGLKVIAVKRTPGACPAELERLSGLEGLDALLQQSDHIVATLPLTPATRGLLDARRVAGIKPGAFFYNVARGGLVDEPALLARLGDGSLGGAAMDVFAQEPLPPDSPWWRAPRTLVFPHIAGHHRDLGADTFELFADNLRRYVTGQPLRNVADFDRGY